ncbi:MAG: NAD(P)H-hydrate epimerase [Pseudomonadota bacterium]
MKGAFPTVANVPEVTVAQMVEIDRLMVDDVGISLIQMMENAGRGLATLARARLGGIVAGCRVQVLAGSGGNGGGAIAAARRLVTWGATVELGLTREPQGVPGAQLEILRRIADVVMIEPGDVGGADLILDGLIGYSLDGAPRGRALAFIEAANASATGGVALDVPSGLGGGGAVMKADTTLALALPKAGSKDPANGDQVGALFVGDISVPPALYGRLSPPVDVPSDLFEEFDIARVMPPRD